MRNFATAILLAASFLMVSISDAYAYTVWNTETSSPAPGKLLGFARGSDDRLYAWAADQGDRRMFAYNTVAKTWVSRAPLPRFLWTVGGTQVNGMIYSVAGYLELDLPGHAPGLLVQPGDERLDAPRRPARQSLGSPSDRRRRRCLRMGREQSGESSPAGVSVSPGVGSLVCRNERPGQPEFGRIFHRSDRWGDLFRWWAECERRSERDRRHVHAGDEHLDESLQRDAAPAHRASRGPWRRRKAVRHRRGQRQRRHRRNRRLLRSGDETWGSGPRMPTTRYNLNAALGRNGAIYALGGTLDVPVCPPCFTGALEALR